MQITCTFEYFFMFFMQDIKIVGVRCANGKIPVKFSFNELRELERLDNFCRTHVISLVVLMVLGTVIVNFWILINWMNRE